MQDNELDKVPANGSEESVTEGKCTVRCVGVPPHTKESSISPLPAVRHCG